MIPNTLETRVSRLERSNRQLQLFVVMLGLAGVGGLLLGLARGNDPLAEVRARRFVAVDENGLDAVRINGGTAPSGPWVLGHRDEKCAAGLVEIGSDGLSVGMNGDWAKLQFDVLKFSRNCGVEFAAEYGSSSMIIRQPMPPEFVPDLSQVEVAKSVVDPLIAKAADWCNGSPAVMLGVRGDPLVLLRNDKAATAVMLTVHEGYGKGIFLKKSGLSEVLSTTPDATTKPATPK